ncbi:MAG: hypothetical protein IJ572_04705 [Bacilli bacterium]|nr:hypothetical protein [Bacilli bacterium]
MKKKIIVIGLILLIIVISVISLRLTIFKDVTTIINLADNLSYEYNEQVYLYDTISIFDGQIITENYLLDTDFVGTKEIEIKYKDSNKWKKTYKYRYEVEDNTTPLLHVSNNLYVEVGKSEKDVLSKTFCGDNYDREVSLEIIGDLDLNTIGNYDVAIKASDDNGNSVSKNTTIHVYQKSNYSNNNSNNNNNIKGVDISYFIKNYKTDNTAIGLDLSSYQNVSDFNLLKENGVEFVILRIGWGPNEDMTFNTDNHFEDFYKRAKEAGLKVGVYYFSYATKLDEVDYEVNYVLDTLKDKEIDLFISYDWENWNLFKDCHMNFVDLNKMATKFMSILKDKGYKAVNYSSKSYLELIWDIDGFDTWLAHYNDETSYEKDFSIWQITDKGSIDGIDGLVDVDILYY